MKRHTFCPLTQLQSLSACQSAIFEIDIVAMLNSRWSTGTVLKGKKAKNQLREITKVACRISTTNIN